MLQSTPTLTNDSWRSILQLLQAPAQLVDCNVFAQSPCPAWLDCPKIIMDCLQFLSIIFELDCQARTTLQVVAIALTFFPVNWRSKPLFYASLLLLYAPKRIFENVISHHCTRSLLWLICTTLKGLTTVGGWGPFIDSSRHTSADVNSVEAPAKISKSFCICVLSSKD